MKYLYKISGIIIVLLFSYWCIKPLLTQGFYPMHDDTQVARVFEMKKALAEGQFPVRWVPDLGYGYGYPIFNFYAPFAYYVGGFINLAGFDSLFATKAMIGLGALLAGVFMYLFAKEFWGRVGGIVSAILYLYAPYHALNIYVRGAIAELWAYAFIPLTAYGFYKIYQSYQAKKKGNESPTLIDWRWISLSAFAYAAVIVSHNLTAMMITPFVIIFAASLTIAKKKLWLPILLSFILSISIASFYWLPVAFEMHFTNVQSIIGGGSDYHDHFVCLQQLWNSPWGYGGSAPGCMDGLSFKLGKLHVILAALSILPLLFVRKKILLRNAIAAGIIGLVIALFFTLQYSQPIWDLIHPMEYFQFPWRFLALASFFLSFLGGSVFLIIPNKVFRLIGGIVLSFAIVFINTDAFVPSKIVTKTAADYTNLQEIRFNTSKISDEYMPQGFHRPKNPSQAPTRTLEIDAKTAKIISQDVRTQKIVATVQSNKDTPIKVNVAYFPAWHVRIDDLKADFKNTSTGLQVTMPQGKHKLTVYSNQTPIEQAGNILSLTGVLVLLAGIITHRKDRKSIAKSS